MSDLPQTVIRPAGRAIKRAFIGTVVVVLMCGLCVVGATASLLLGLFDDGTTAAYGSGCGNGETVDPFGALPDFSGLTVDQVRNAAIIIRMGQDLEIPPRGWVIGVATAMQESRLNNLPFLGDRNDHDSLGLFQQRPSQGWGTVEQLSDPAYQAQKFFEKLVTIAGWESLPLTVAAQRVQVSAYPDAYAKHESLASSIVDALTGGAARAVGSEIALRCAAGSGEISAAGWTVPVDGPVVSGFRTASRPTHQGVDISVPKGTPIHAASAGTVLVVLCNASLYGSPYSCDVDGSPTVLGCGWYVDILHANNTITRYCHQVQRPFVTVGQHVNAGEVIGLSGTSGNSSGPHLHFEVHLYGDSSSQGAVDPLVFMNQVGAPLAGSG